MEFPKDVHEEITDAVAGYSSDQVAAYLVLKDALDRKDKLPHEQRQYLQTTVDAIEQRAQGVLSRDAAVALAKMDLRGAFIVASVAGSVPGDVATRAKATVATLRSRLIAGYRVGELVFSITNAKAKVVNGPYTEGSEFMNDRISLTPKSGFRLVRVTAKATNISQASDPGYALFLLGRLGRISARFNKPKGKPRRLVDESMAFLVPRGGDWRECVHVCEGCSVMRSMTLTVGERMYFLGRYVPEGASFDLDLIFTLPEGLALPGGQSDAQFVLLGAQPVAVTIE